ncbi:MAG TPA: thioesterase family protein [Steroidobacteraceae bacterium]|nr:thioesterase family protein [Steroidobacteraceae bacterium]
MPFSTTVLVRFAHVDPAAIVFYPRYFEMLNGAVEDWFSHLGWDFRTLHVGLQMATPIVKLECEFVAPSELGETLTIAIAPTNVGRSSCTLHYCVSCNGTERVRATGTLVCMSIPTRRSIPWPDGLRAKMTAAL